MRDARAWAARRTVHFCFSGISSAVGAARAGGLRHAQGALA
ncbi:hypothetical protein A2U01_0073890, partial [Trifolium medium]|nr:hypothetical protein [Trifolium medium]